MDRIAQIGGLRRPVDGADLWMEQIGGWNCAGSAFWQLVVLAAWIGPSLRLDSVRYNRIFGSKCEVANPKEG